MGARLVLHRDECDKLFFPKQAQLLSTSTGPAIGDLEHSPTTADTSSSSKNVLQRLAGVFVSHPHRFSHSWCHVNTILLYLTLGSLIFHACIFFMPLSNVNGGLRENRRFLYGVQTHVEFVSIIPWIETVNFAIPSAKIALRARVVAVLVGMLVAKFVDAFIAEGWWGGLRRQTDPVFPIPFSTIVSLTLSLPFSLGVLYYLTRHRVDSLARQKFRLCFKVLAYYLGSVFVAGCWAVGMRYLLEHQLLQIFWAFMFEPIRLVCKIFFLSSLLLKLNSRRWVPMVIVVDVIFGRVQVATLPYFGGFITVLAVVLGTSVTLIWRFYSGVDRIALLWTRIWAKGSSDIVDRELGLQQGARRVGFQSCVDLPHRIMRASLKDIHLISMRLNGNSDGGFRAWADLDEEEDSLGSEGLGPEMDKSDSDDDSNCQRQDPLKERKIQSKFTDKTDCTSENSSSSAISIQLHNEGEDEASKEYQCQSTCNEKEACETSQDKADVECGQSCPMQQHQDVKHDLDVSDRSTAELASLDDSSEPDLEAQQPNEVESVHDLAEQSLSSNGSEASDSGDHLPNEVEFHVNTMTVEDRRRVFRECARLPENAVANHHSKLHEVDWEQRQMFHVVDSIGSEVLITIVRIHHMATIGFIRNLPVSKHLNRTFDISDDQWHKANIYGWTFVLANILVMLTLSLSFRVIQKELDPERRLTLNRVLTYLFRNHFWFFFLWLTITGALACSTMINHFGADFRLSFEWLSCRGVERMNWPGCVE